MGKVVWIARIVKENELKFLYYYVIDANTGNIIEKTDLK